MRCEPIASGTDAESWFELPVAMDSESTYSFIAVTANSLSSAAAVNCTGEGPVELAAGEQMFTVRSTVATHPVLLFTVTLALALLVVSATLVALTVWLPLADGAV
jgi:hypothetical protein